MTAKPSQANVHFCETKKQVPWYLEYVNFFSRAQQTWATVNRWLCKFSIKHVSGGNSNYLIFHLLNDHLQLCTDCQRVGIWREISCTYLKLLFNEKTYHRNKIKFIRFVWNNAFIFSRKDVIGIVIWFNIDLNPMKLLKCFSSIHKVYAVLCKFPKSKILRHKINKKIHSMHAVLGIMANKIFIGIFDIEATT